MSSKPRHGIFSKTRHGEGRERERKRVEQKNKRDLKREGGRHVNKRGDEKTKATQRGTRNEKKAGIWRNSASKSKVSAFSRWL